MGMNVKNHYLIPHWQSGTRQGIKFRVHQSGIQVDVTSTETTAQEWSDLETEAGVSQSAFDIKAGSVWGSDYDNLITADKGSLRSLFQTGLP